MEDRITRERDVVDDIYGEYPFILYKHFFITRNNITKFCKMMSKINQRMTLGADERNQIECLENLVTQKLHMVTVPAYLNSSENKLS